MNDLKKLKWFSILIVVLATLYPAVELTRCIIQYMIIDNLGEDPISQYYFELVFIWAFYLSFPFLLERALNLAFRIGKKES